MGRFFFVAMLALVSALGIAAAFWPAKPAPLHPYFAGDTQPLAVAHRAAGAFGPENTLLGAQLALDAGADVLEFDIQRLQDGTLIGFYDQTFDRMTGQTGSPIGVNADRLETLDPGYGFIDGKGLRPYANQAVRIPKLDDILVGFPETRLVLEITNEDFNLARDLCDGITRRGAENRVLVGSFFDKPLRLFRKTCPQVATSFGPSDVRTFEIMRRLRVSRLAPLPGQVLQIPMEAEGSKLVSRALIDAAHARGMKVHVWVINDYERMKKLISMGVDGIVSDRPDLVRQAINEAPRRSNGLMDSAPTQ